jgi:hypothetical protein
VANRLELAARHAEWVRIPVVCWPGRGLEAPKRLAETAGKARWDPPGFAIRSHLMADPEPESEELGEDDDDRRKVPSDTYAHVQPSPLPAMGPDGAPALGGIGQPAPLPPATPENFICLRGPCRHYWEMQTHLHAQNPALTWDKIDGLRATMVCPACKGERARLEVPALWENLPPGSGAPCTYAPTQGIWTGKPCLLPYGHEGAHHHDPDHAPAPRPVTCETCNGAGYVVDPDGERVTEPRQTTRSCLRQPGVDTDLTDDIVYDCNMWDPRDDKATDHSDSMRDKRRSRYLKLHPARKE